MNDDFTSLEGTLEAVWRLLEAGPKDRNSPANVVCLATSSSEGAYARMVVLRMTDRSHHTLHFFTHATSEKLKQLKVNSRGEVLVWDEKSQFQIRLKVRLSVEKIDENLWSNLGEGAKLNYATDPLPGTPIASPNIAWTASSDHKQMKRLLAQVQSIETLHIASEGLYRAEFDDNGSRWIAP